MKESFYPDWTEKRLVADDSFAAAYDSCSGEKRAWIKKTIAQVHAMTAPMLGPSSITHVRHRQGFASAEESTPLSCAVVFLDDTCTAASLAVATAVPMQMSGVRHLCAVRLCEEAALADDVLAGLELVGLETVFRMNEADARVFLAFLVEKGDCAILFHGQGEALARLRTAAGYASPPLRLWAPFRVESVSVWADTADQWDWETLAWVHDCVEILVYGPCVGEPSLPGAFRRMGGDFAEMLEQPVSARYVPRRKIHDARRGTHLVLSPGQEGCWAWPGLTAAFFRSTCLALSDDE